LYFYAVRKPAVLFLLLLMLMNSTEIYQLVRLPQLFSHYQEHRAENAQLTFLEFLGIHYAQGNVRDADYDKDQQLPYKTDNCCSGFNIGYYMITQTILPTVPVYSAEKEYVVMNKNAAPASYFNSIWQPPRA